MRITRSAIHALALVATMSVALRAQEEDFAGRRGMSISVGIGATSAGISCSPDCGVDRKSGPSALVRVAGHISPQFTLGIEATAFRGSVEHPSGSGSWTLSWFMLAAQWYPNSEADFFIKAGVGVSAAKADLPFPAFGSPTQSNIVSLSASDYGAMVGFGRDFFVTERWALTPFAAYLFAPSSQGTISQANSGARISSDIMVLGLAISIP